MSARVFGEARIYGEALDLILGAAKPADDEGIAHYDDWKTATHPEMRGDEGSRTPQRTPEEQADLHRRMREHDARESKYYRSRFDAALDLGAVGPGCLHPSGDMTCSRCAAAQGQP